MKDDLYQTSTVAENLSEQRNKKVILVAINYLGNLVTFVSSSPYININVNENPLQKPRVKQSSSNGSACL